jgi:hypothetical protein
MQHPPRSIQLTFTRSLVGSLRVLGVPDMEAKEGIWVRKILLLPSFERSRFSHTTAFARMARPSVIGHVGEGCIDRSCFSHTTAFARMARPSVNGYVEEECYLVDPASSHMLVSKIKPCMCKYEQIQTVKLRMAH